MALSELDSEGSSHFDGLAWREAAIERCVKRIARASNVRGEHEYWEDDFLDFDAGP